MFARAFNVEYEQLPHRGRAPALTDTVAGTCDGLFDSTGFSIPLLRQGQLRTLGVTALEPVAGHAEDPDHRKPGGAWFACDGMVLKVWPFGAAEH